MIIYWHNWFIVIVKIALQAVNRPMWYISHNIITLKMNNYSQCKDFPIFFKLKTKISSAEQTPNTRAQKSYNNHTKIWRLNFNIRFNSNFGCLYFNYGFGTLWCEYGSCVNLFRQLIVRHNSKGGGGIKARAI